MAGNTDETPAKQTFTVAEPDPGTDPGEGAHQNPPPPPDNQGTPGGQPPVKPGKCANLKGKKRARCVRRNCGRPNKHRPHKRYSKCVKAVTRNR